MGIKLKMYMLTHSCCCPWCFCPATRTRNARIQAKLPDGKRKPWLKILFQRSVSGTPLTIINKYKRRSRTVIFSVNVAHKRLIEHTANNFHKIPNIDKKYLNGNLVGRIKAVALENYEFPNKQNEKTNWTFSIFSLPKSHLKIYHCQVSPWQTNWNL